MKATLVEPQGPSSNGKVPFATSGPHNLTNTGDIHKNNYKNIILEIKEANVASNQFVTVKDSLQLGFYRFEQVNLAKS